MRCSAVSPGSDLSTVEKACKGVGALNIKMRPRMKVVFCDLTPAQANELADRGLRVRAVKRIETAQIAPPTGAVNEEVEAAGLNLADVFNEFRGSFLPPLTGVGNTVIIADTGIRTSHESLVDKVIYEENFSDADSCDDIYGHGTSVAFIVAGGVHGDRKSGVAPGTTLINLKCLNDDGEGTDEMVINAIDKACDLVEIAQGLGKPTWDPTYPNVINLSVGAEDDGDPDDPVRAACRVAVEDYGLQVIAAAGNGGDRASTILIPASDPEVIAIGGLRSDIFMVWEHSSRGPTEEGEIKPDFCIWATGIYAAHNTGNSEYTYKSGTSFSAPIASGLIGLIWELGRRTFGPYWSVTWYDIEEVGEQVCVKPEEAPEQKDNSWGYGLPAINEMVKGAMYVSAPAAPTDIVSSIMPIMMLMMIMPMMGGA